MGIGQPSMVGDHLMSEDGDDASELADGESDGGGVKGAKTKSKTKRMKVKK